MTRHTAKIKSSNAYQNIVSYFIYIRYISISEHSPRGDSVEMIIPRLLRPLKGIVPPMVTPLIGRDQLDYRGLERLVEHILDGGVHGLFILGTTGEGPALSYALRRELIERVTRQVGSRVPVLVCVTDTAYVETLRLTEFAAKSGASAIVMAPPYYFYSSQLDLLRLVEGLAAESALPLFLYNMPGLTKIQYEPDTVAIAADFPNVVGLKDSSADIDYLERVVAAVKNKEDFTVLLGPEELLVEGMKLGIHGGVNGGANLFPRLFVELYEACVAGRESEIQALRQSVLDLGSAIYSLGEPEFSYIRGLKCALSVIGICSDQPAWPYQAAIPEQRRAIEAHLKNCAYMTV
jgi:dihydrodipicolinate synthase/N-acetylneuraminate lyase